MHIDRIIYPITICVNSRQGRFLQIYIITTEEGEGLRQKKTIQADEINLPWLADRFLSIG